jgi:glucose-1-phosphate adenylyltransferase
MARREVIAMILAGGQGSRLGALTKHLAKPAVPFGGRYRIIDFTLSNCANSGIGTVGVLTQYQPLVLNTYIGNGQPWDLDRNDGGAFILPPYQKSSRSDWYKGTANAIHQNAEFIDSYDPKNLLVLSGDHIYKMDYAKMLRSHIDKGADATIAVIEVPWEEASRFGIMAADETGRVVEFAEKPAKPKSNLASMGIYIFTWDVLKRVLVEDDADDKSTNDFGKDVIPRLLSEGANLQTYRFSGYWKDVGTVESLWQANMDLLDCPDDINLYDRTWRIYSRNPVKPAHYIARGARLQNSCLTDGCIIEGEVDHSVLFHSVVVEAGAIVKDSVLMPGVVIEAGAYVHKAIIGTNTIVSRGARIGYSSMASSPYIRRICSDDITVVERGLRLREGADIPGNCMVELRDDVAADSVIERRTTVR